MSSPISEHGYENDYTGVPNFSPLYPELLITDGDGSILRETQDFSVLDGIVRRNDMRTLEQYLEKGSWAIPRAPDVPRQLIGDSPEMEYFFMAAATGSLEALQMLLTHKAEEDNQRPEQIRFGHRRYELLNVAARWGNLNITQFLLENQPLYSYIHDRDSEGFTPILAAANFFETQFLLPFNKEEDLSPGRSERVMNLLLDYGACASDALPPGHWENTKTPWQTVLSFSVEWASAALIERLIEAGADVRSKTRAPRSESGLDDRLEEENFEVEPLFIACSVANLDAVKTIIGSLQGSMSAEEISHIRGIRGTLPIHSATRNTLMTSKDSGWVLQERLPNITAILDFLLDLDPTTINAQDDDGNTPLHHAARAFGRHKRLFAPVFTFLCDRGANASIRNKKLETPLHTLLKVYENELRRYSCYEDEFILDTSALLTLLAHGAGVSDVDHDGNTPLHLVAEVLNYSNGVSLLLDRGADPSQPNAKQETALHRAARGTCLTGYANIIAPKKIAMQDDVMGRLVNIGGEQLMDAMDAEGKTPRQLREEKRETWRDRDIPLWMRQQNGSSSRGGRGG
ncbi:hypothetical protein NW768_002649 [Fusarium equiseti]|uniref:Ankyrin n=1 Tax=Fusarium equiseti TaxID=61235 RepID=A0ABQ8RNY4_FUSEQ|nr:hypothetical protein NW768_002649 [Fusarium equiseti]